MIVVGWRMLNPQALSTGNVLQFIDAVGNGNVYKCSCNLLGLRNFTIPVMGALCSCAVLGFLSKIGLVGFNYISLWNFRKSHVSWYLTLKLGALFRLPKYWSEFYRQPHTHFSFQVIESPFEAS